MTLPTTTSASSIKSGHGENSSDPELAVPAATPVGTAPLYSKKRLMLQEASCHATMLIAGWSDASSGPLIPYIQLFYGISYTVDLTSLLTKFLYFSGLVSLLFVGQMVGFLTAGFLNSYLTTKYGLGKVITIGAIIQAVGYVFLIPGFPFPMMPCCYAVIGFGMALQDAQANVYVATLPNAEHKLGILHASYGFGALVSPLAGTAFTSSGIRFSYFYTLSVSFALLNVAILLWSFKFNYRADEGPEPEQVELNTFEGNLDGSAKQRVLPKKGRLQQTLSSSTMWKCSIFILVYVGAEVSMGGWIVTFMVDRRNGGPSAGYIATGFWGGITLGRALLPRLNVLVGEKRIVPYYVLAGICLELVIWFARNLVAAAVMVALVGVVMGPIYPITISLATRILPRSLHSSGVGFIAAFGQTGSAIFPFLTGALSQKYSTFVLQPIMISLFGVMACIWYWVPTPDNKRD